MMAVYDTIHYLLLLCSMLSSTQRVWGYNFDTSVPTIVKSGIGSSDGFGFSMTQHQFTDGRKVVLVSAPRINGTDFFGNPVESEGGVYLCPFDNSKLCDIEPVFQTKDNAFFTLLATDPRSFDGQLLGYTLRTFENHVVVCAPLYVSTMQIIPIDGVNYGYGTPTGRCVVLNQDLSDLEQDILQITANDFLGSSSSLTMGGVDVDIINMDIGGGVTDRIVIGSAFGGATSNGGNPPGQLVVTSVSPDTLGDSNTTVDSGESSPDVTGLLGSKIEVGRFTEDVLQVASSAPRADMHRGQIKIFNVPNNEEMSVQYTITGPQPDGYFGYDFVAQSFSEDGQYHSLVVGCPLCDNDRGSIFVYLHSGDKANPFPADPVHIPSPDSFIPGRFGTAVSIIGDSDGDGIIDIAVSAPYAGEGGVVYICRGYRGGILPPEQAIHASSMSNAFGYTLSGGLDIDDNGYPDLTVGDLTGTVTTLRSSPLVTVVMEFNDIPSTVDLMNDRKCTINDDITLLCFDVSSCFYYETLHSVEVTQFAFQYHLTVDGDRANPRVIIVNKTPSEQTYTIMTENIVTENVTMTGAGVDNKLCVGPYTFAIRADFAETTPIPIHLAVSESDSVPPLPVDPATPTLGGPLTPVLRRYTEGDQAVVSEISHEVLFGLDCEGGSSSDCEPEYTISLSPSFDNNEPLLLTTEAMFSFEVTIDNTAGDDGLSPILVLDLPNGILLNSTMSTTEGAVTNCESSSSSQPQCLLRNPMPSNTTLSLTLSFRFNSSAIDLTSPTLSLVFSVVDGLTGNTSASVGITVTFNAEASFGIGVTISEDQYQADRHALTQNTATIPLNETGPTLRFSVLVSNSRDSSNGSTIPSSTVVIHIPVAMQQDRNSNFRPLLIPFQLFSASENVVCNHYNIIANDLLSPIQRPSNFIPQGVGSPPDDSMSLREECEGQRGELKVRCGQIVCNIDELEPGTPPSEITVFAYLFSPSIIVRESFSIYADVNSQVQGLTITDREDDISTVSFEVLPAVIEVSLECFQYWIIVVSVIAGLFVLFILIGALACCGVFGRWYKRKGDETVANSTETVDGHAFTPPRIIPPLPGTTMNGVRSSEGGDRDNEEEKVDLDKEEEAEQERQLEVDMMASHTAETSAASRDSATDEVGDIDIPLDQFHFDPHIGVTSEGEETEI